MWILILTITSNSGVSIEHVPGLATEQVCMTAGTVWQDSLWGWGKNSSSFVCVKGQ